MPIFYGLKRVSYGHLKKFIESGAKGAVGGTKYEKRRNF